MKSALLPHSLYFFFPSLSLRSAVSFPYPKNKDVENSIVKQLYNDKLACQQSYSRLM